MRRNDAKQSVPVSGFAQGCNMYLHSHPIREDAFKDVKHPTNIFEFARGLNVNLQCGFAPLCEAVCSDSYASTYTVHIRQDVLLQSSGDNFWTLASNRTALPSR
ncbi:hypothetical protein LshimejAT787_1602970 [Lyophyllum shimeji]|uniref:Uncharacterized protein n=1 Tax=Lyophyllum shimeji TaxID=47721 RepID=A0A9P3UTN4_LYOSH|nr:hypothetical protein LshimejAT787_1602970 [Lyophyllum shimeji]